MFLEKIAAQEEKLLTERSKKASKIPFTILDDSLEYPTHLITEMSSRLKVVNYDTFRTKWYQRALIPSQILNLPFFSNKSLYGAYGELESKIDVMTNAYLNGIVWIYKYYKLGTAAINSNFVFGYFFVPLLQDIYRVASEDFETNLELIEASEGMDTFTPLEQLLSSHSILL